MKAQLLNRVAPIFSINILKKSMILLISLYFGINAFMLHDKSYGFHKNEAVIVLFFGAIFLAAAVVSIVLALVLAYIRILYDHINNNL